LTASKRDEPIIEGSIIGLASPRPLSPVAFGFFTEGEKPVAYSEREETNPSSRLFTFGSFTEGEKPAPSVSAEPIKKRRVLFSFHLW